VTPVLQVFSGEPGAQSAASALPRTMVSDRLKATIRYYREFPKVHRPMLPPDVFKGPPPVYTGPDNLYGAVRQQLANLGVLRAVRRLVGIRNIMTARYYFSYGSGAVLSAAPGVVDLRGHFQPGVNVIGYFHHESGVGQIARDLVRSLRVQDFPVSAIDAETPTREVDLAPVGLQHRVNVFSVNADQTYVVQSKLGKRAYKGRYNVGYWFWELPQFPKRWAVSFREYDEIWVASEFVRGALRPMTDLPITRVPVPVEVQLPASPLTRTALGLPDEGFLFLFIFNGASVFTRKNPLGLISAFERAFNQNERMRDVRLVMKVMNLDLEEGDGKSLADGMRAVNGILLSETMDRQVVYNLVDQCDAYASLHRSEGYGLTMAEAMALGKPVLGTAYSGNVDFMDDDNSFLVPFVLVTLEHDVPPYEAGSTWAEPDLNEAARLMRLVVDNPREAAARGARAREKMQSEFSPASVGHIISNRLEEILGSLEGF
jgi:glycosyltransferase involved in cell wall biosynthesis